MGHLRPSFSLLLLLGFLCVASSNPISGLFGKSSDDAKAAEEEKDVKDAGVTTTTTTATTPTGTTSSSCSGLSGFFHLCDKNEQTEPPKKVKRDANEEDDSDSDSESDSDSDEDEGKNEPTTSSNSEVEVEKRQVGDPEAPVLGEIPPVLEESMRVPENSEGQEEDGTVKRRQVEDSDEKEEENDTEEMEQTSRRRRDCRDSYGDYSKDCRRKREYVPACFGTHCIKKPSEAPEAADATTN